MGPSPLSTVTLVGNSESPREEEEEEGMNPEASDDDERDGRSGIGILIS